MKARYGHMIVAVLLASLVLAILASLTLVDPAHALAPKSIFKEDDQGASSSAPAKIADGVVKDSRFSLEEFIGHLNQWLELAVREQANAFVLDISGLGGEGKVWATFDASGTAPKPKKLLGEIPGHWIAVLRKRNPSIRFIRFPVLKANEFEARAMRLLGVEKGLVERAWDRAMDKVFHSDIDRRTVLKASAAPVLHKITHHPLVLWARRIAAPETAAWSYATRLWMRYQMHQLLDDTLVPGIRGSSMRFDVEARLQERIATLKALLDSGVAQDREMLEDLKDVVFCQPFQIVKPLAAQFNQWMGREIISSAVLARREGNWGPRQIGGSLWIKDPIERWLNDLEWDAFVMAHRSDPLVTRVIPDWQNFIRWEIGVHLQQLFNRMDYGATWGNLRRVRQVVGLFKEAFPAVSGKIEPQERMALGDLKRQLDYLGEQLKAVWLKTDTEDETGIRGTTDIQVDDTQNISPKEQDFLKEYVREFLNTYKDIYQQNTEAVVEALQDAHCWDIPLIPMAAQEQAVSSGHEVFDAIKLFYAKMPRGLLLKLFTRKVRVEDFQKALGGVAVQGQEMRLEGIASVDARTDTDMPGGSMLQITLVFGTSNPVHIVVHGQGKAFKILYKRDATMSAVLEHHDPLEALKDPILKSFIRDMLVENYTKARVLFAGRDVAETVDSILNAAALEAFESDPLQAAYYINQEVFDFAGPESEFHRLEKAHLYDAVGAWADAEEKYAQSFFRGPRIYDCGCGSGDFLREMARQYPGKNFELIGSDVYDYVVNDGSFTFVKQEGNRIPVESIGKDGVHSSRLSYVLHHTYPEDQSPHDPKTRGKIVEFLKDHRDVLTPGGRLIVFEDSYPSDPASTLSHLIRGPPPEMDAGQQPALTARFLALTSEQKYRYLVWNDWYWNMLYSGLYDMQMPYRYYTMEEWLGIFLDAGFEIREAQYWGFTINRMHGASTAFFVLEKTPKPVRHISFSLNDHGAFPVVSAL